MDVFFALLGFFLLIIASPILLLYWVIKKILKKETRIRGWYFLIALALGFVLIIIGGIMSPEYKLETEKNTNQTEIVSTEKNAKEKQKPDSNIEKKTNEDTGITKNDDNNKKGTPTGANIHLLSRMLVFLLLIVGGLGLLIYDRKYYKSEEFLALKERLQDNVQDCNNFNSHIAALNATRIGIDQLNYGEGKYYDNSTWNYKRTELKKQKKAENICQCSRTVCDNARKQPFKYICKYFGIDSTEKNLSQFENLLNNLQAASEGLESLKKEREELLKSIWNEVPALISWNKKRFSRKLGLEDISFKEIEFPVYIFQYVSSGGKASMKFELEMNFTNLNGFIEYLDKNIKYRKSAQGQRALMTSALRSKIKERDHYTCQNCGNSTQNEPNLLLEIDHIQPISKGGLSVESNLQTLCWRCNRSKGAKIVN